MRKTAKAQNLHPKDVGFPSPPTCDKQQKLKAYIPKTLAFQIFPHATNSKSSKPTSQRRWLSKSSNMPKTAKAQNLHPNVGFPNLPRCEKNKSSKPTSQRWLSKSSHMRKSSKSSKPTSQNVGFPNPPTCQKQQKLNTYIPKTLAFQIFQHAKKQQKLKTCIPKTLAFQIFPHATNSKSSKPTSQKRWLSKSSHMRQTAKAQNLHPNVGFSNLPTCDKQQKLKTYIPKTLAFQIFPHAKNSKSSKPTSQKRWLSKSSHMRQTAKAQNLHPKNFGFQIFPHAKNSKSSKPTSQKGWLSKSSYMRQTAKAQNLHPNVGFPNLPTCEKTAKAQNLHPKDVGFPNLPTCERQQKLKAYIPKTLAFQIFPHATNSKSSKPTSQRRWLSKSSNMSKTAWLSKSSHMPKTAKAQHLHPKNVGFSNLPTCDKQQKLKTYIPKTLAFQILQHAKNSKSSKPTSQKTLAFQIFPHATNSKSSKPTSQRRWLSKSSNMRKTAKAQSLHPKNVGFPNLPTCDKQQKLKTYIPTLAFQIFPHATNSKSSKPTSQKRWLSKSSHMRQTAKAQNLHPKNVGFPNPPTCQKQQKLNAYIPKTLAFQIFPHATNSKSSKPTSQRRWLSKSSNMPKTAKAQSLHPNVGFPNLPTCDKQQKLKTYIPKTLAFQILQHAKNSKSSKPTSQRWLSKSSHMRQTAKAQNLHPNVGFPNLPTCDKQQKLKTYIPKTLAFQILQHVKNSMAFQIFPHATNSKSSKPTSQKRWLSKSSHMRQTAKAQNLHPNVGFPNLPTCDKQQKLKTYIPKTLAFQIFPHATNIPKTLSQVPPEASKNSPGPWGCWKALEALKPSKTSHSWKLTWKPKRGSIKTTVPLRWGYMGFHVSLGECREV